MIFNDHLENRLFCREIASGQCSIIKMEGTDNPMVKAADKVAEAFVLFAQVPPLLLLLLVVVFFVDVVVVSC